MWKHNSSPSNEDLVQATRDAKLSKLDSELIVHGNQGPQFIVRGDYKIILIHIPIREHTIKSIENRTLTFIIQKDSLITITRSAIPMLDEIFADYSNNPDAYQETGTSPLSLAFTIIDRLNTSTLKKIHHLLKRVEIAEDAIFHGNERKMVEEIAILSRDVLDFHRIALPQKGLFQSIHRQYAFTIPEQEVLSHIHNQAEQMWYTLQALHSSMQELRNTNDSLLQHQENELLRSIFSYSILAIPFLAIINVFNPHRSGATILDSIFFWGIIAFLIIVLIFIFARAKKKRVL